MLGLSKKFNDRWLLGLAVQQTKSTVDFADDRGGFELDDTRLSLFADYKNDRWFAQAIATVSLIADYNDIERKIALGTGQRLEQGETDGDSFAIKLPVGYDIVNKKTCMQDRLAVLIISRLMLMVTLKMVLAPPLVEFDDQDKDSLLVEGGLFLLMPHSQINLGYKPAYHVSKR